MLVLSGDSKSVASMKIGRQLHSERIIRNIVLRGSETIVESEGWGHFWKPCIPRWDQKLIHRLNRLKASWSTILRANPSQVNYAQYCWRYFGLLHYVLQIAQEKKDLREWLPLIRRIIGFECFTIELKGGQNTCAGALACHRNPVFLLGRLPARAPNPTPRHVPLIMPEGSKSPFYHYRQYTLRHEGVRLCLFPSTDLAQRTNSFLVMDRFARLTCNQCDPYSESRGQLLGRRVLVPLTSALRKLEPPAGRHVPWRILDLGAGTGHMLGYAWLEICRAMPNFRKSIAELHCVDSSGPSPGRTYGLSGRARGISSVEWTCRDYRALIDDDRWLREQNHFHFAVLSRLLDNMSVFSLEPLNSYNADGSYDESCLPHYCLSPRKLPAGINELRVRTINRRAQGGRFMPHFSLCEFFTALRSVWYDNLEYLCTSKWILPFRRFNPASLTTQSGRSVIAQLLKVCRALVIEDIDLSPEDLIAHMQQFGLTDTTAVQFLDDGFVTEAFHYVIAKSDVACSLQGKRLW